MFYLNHKKEMKCVDCKVPKYIPFGLVWVSLFNAISTHFRLFNAKAILLEEQ